MTMIYGKQKPAQSGQNFIFSRIEISAVSILHGKHSVAQLHRWVNYLFTLLIESICYLVAASNRFFEALREFAW
jgi:hypothetical protein